jgi:putative DNA primase/helicase
MSRDPSTAELEAQLRAAAAAAGFLEAPTNGHRTHAAGPTAADLTEDALALEFCRQHSQDLRYVHEWGARGWLRWDGARWDHERTLAVYDLARAMLREFSASDRLTVKLESAATVSAIVQLARVDRRFARVTEDFDQDAWLLNTPAGTVELQSGELRAHRRTDGLTKVTPVSPVAGEAPLWRACLHTWTQADAELEAFLQRLTGYWLTGSVREEIITVVWGSGANGKTKFIETIRGCLGAGYAGSVAMETLIVTKGEQHPTDLADLRGKRLAITTETDEGRALAEAKVKSLSGGDLIRGRRMRENFFEFAPTHKLVIVGNHRPSLRNVDEAMRRRLVLVPFTAVIPPADRDPQLAEKLRAEYPAILQWMIGGCLAWQTRGLDPPVRVTAATAEYLESADAFGRWLEESCVLGPTASATKSEMFQNWKSWAEASGEFVGTQRRLSERLAGLPDLDEARLGKSRTRSWIGIGLRRGD